jgi:hypothetical protein
MLDIIGAMSAHTPKTTTTAKSKVGFADQTTCFARVQHTHTQCTTIFSSPLNVVQVQLLWSKLSN